MATYYVNSSVGNDANAGTSPGSGNAWATIAHAVATIAPGDWVWIEAIAGNASSYPTTGLDYSMSGYMNASAIGGSTTVGWTTFAGRNGIPTIGSDGLIFYLANYIKFKDLYMTSSGTQNGSLGIVNGSGGPLSIQNCTFNLNNQAGLRGLVINNGSEVVGGEVYGGTSSPTFSSGSEGIFCGDYGVAIDGVKVRKCRAAGVVTANLTIVARSRIYGNAGDGITCGNVGANFPARLVSNTIDANLGHGIDLSNTAGAMCASAYDNLITNHTGSGKAAIYASDGTTATNDARKRFTDYNYIYNNTSNYTNISAGAHDLAVDPQYASASTGDFTPGNAALQAGYP